ncbi:hypothetical protein HanLR1_Chr14g0533871 [Helianthus annuus]|nr:hypothetical protein HanHA89_Chr14g0571471 [Helianthus annuus]KAJ0656273.1 hypothetical protein HanLR1_Chr14g0533871 [Helianthus annuus]
MVMCGFQRPSYDDIRPLSDLTSPNSYSDIPQYPEIDKREKPNLPNGGLTKGNFCLLLFRNRYMRDDSRGSEINQKL